MEKDVLTAKLRRIFAPYDRSDSPGLVVGVAQHGRLIFRYGFGLANVEHGVINTPLTRMRIGSSSKPFTSLAVLLLSEDGRINLEDGVRTYLPELPPLAGEPTVRQLMAHSGGYRSYLDLSLISDGLAIKPAGEAFKAQQRQTEVNFAPGSRMIYCNGGYHLLSLIIERQSGMSFEAFLERRIFSPLEMHSTKSVPSDFEIHKGLASLYVPLPGGGYRRGMLPTEEVRGEGGIVSTVDDILRWLLHLRHPNRIGSETSWRQMKQPVSINNGFIGEYALGLVTDSYRGAQVIYHSGSVIGGACQMITVEDHELDIILISNGASANPVDLAWKIIDTVIGDKNLGSRLAPARSKDHVRLIGSFREPDTGMLYKFADVAGELTVAILAAPPLLLTLDPNGVLRLPFSRAPFCNLSIQTTLLPEDPLNTLRISDMGYTVDLQRLPENPPSSELLAEQLIGTYWCSDLDAASIISLNEGRLEMLIVGNYGRVTYRLAPIAHDLLIAKWLNVPVHLPEGATVQMRFARGEVSELVFNTTRTRNLRFVKND